MKIAIGSDKSGFILKESIKAHLLNKGHDVIEVGTLSMEEPKPFYTVAPIAAKLIQKNEVEKAILICGTGMGMAMVANKFQGVYAAVVESEYTAKKSRAINNANILTMGGWIISDFMGCEIVDTFLSTDFTEGLEPWRQEFLKNSVNEIRRIEDEIYNDGTDL